MRLDVSIVVTGRWKVNTYLIKKDMETWLVDPGDMNDLLYATILEEQIILKGIFCTHGHFDHISGIGPIQAVCKAPTYLHSGDLRLVNQVNLYRKLAGAENSVPVPRIDERLEQISELDLGSEVLKVVPAPGHTKGSTVFVIDRRLIIGDLFYNGEIGRTDLPGGDKEQIKKTAENIIAEYEGFDVYPGHGEPYRLDSMCIDRIKRSMNGS